MILAISKYKSVHVTGGEGVQSLKPVSSATRPAAGRGWKQEDAPTKQSAGITILRYAMTASTIDSALMQSADTSI